MSDNNQFSVPSDTSSAVRVSNSVLLAAVIFLFMVVVFVFLLYLYTKKFMGSSPLNSSRNSRFIFVANSVPVNNGLETRIIQSLPVKVFHAEDFKEGLECSVCLSEMVEGEEARILPKCNHGFHVECIDMWFHSHSTCPLCRSPVDTELVHESDPESVPIPSLDTVLREGYLTEPHTIPTNVLYWGTQNEVTNSPVQESTSNTNGTGSRKSGTSDMLVIDIPRRAIENLVPSPMSPLPRSVMPLDEMKSPVSARFRSLKQLLSRGKNVVGPSCSPRGGDIEQGIVETPKTPKS